MWKRFFVAFSCKKRMIYPSCATKRSILFSEKVRDIVKPFPHLHITYTIPKLLRGYFRRNRKLLKLLIQSANFVIKQYFHETLGMKDRYTGGIFCIQSHGSLFNFYPHIHALVLAGILKDDTFYQPFNISTDVIAQLFRARVLAILFKQGIFPHPTKRSLIIMASIAVLIEARREKKKEERAQWRGKRSKERLKPARVGHS